MKKLLPILVVLLPAPVLACGSVSMTLSGYWSPDNDRQAKEAIIESAGCGDHVNYFPVEDDRIIEAVAVDAIRKAFPRTAIESLLQRFHCAYAARHHPDYAVIRSFIGEQRYNEFCRTDELERIFIVSVPGGAILRNAPNSSGNRLAAIREGAYVKLVAQQDGWYQVDGGLYGAGYIRGDLLSPY
jgi:hypothetical protein